MSDAWTRSPASSDDEMNITDIDYTELRALQDVFLKAVAAELCAAARTQGRPREPP